MGYRVVFFVLFFLFSRFVYSNEVMSKVSNLITQLRYEEAIVELEKQLEVQPNNVDYYIALVDLLLRIGEIDLAQGYIDKALKYDKHNIFINSYLMEISRLKGDLKRASSIAERILKFPEAKTNLLFVVMYSRLLSEFNVYDAEKFLSLYGKVYKDYRVFLEMARLYLLMGEEKKVKEFLDRAASISRFDKNLYLLYGEYYFRKGDYVEAVKSLEKAILFPGKKEREYYLLASSYYRMGDYNKTLKYLDKFDVRPEVFAKVMFMAGNYNELVRNFDNSQSEVVRYFVEDASIRLSSQSISEKRRELSDYRLRRAIELKKSGVPYYELYLRRAIRLNPLNYDAWSEVANYYRYYHSPYFAFDELRVARNLFVNNVKLQDLFISIGSYVSNVSKLSSWDIKVEGKKQFKILFEIVNENVGLENSFFEDVLRWALESIRVVNAVIEVTSRKDVFYRKNYDFVFVVRPRVVKEFFTVELSLLDPVNSRVLREAIASVKFGDRVVSELYYGLRSKMFSLLPYVGIVEGVKDNRFVVRFLKTGHKGGDEIVVFDTLRNEKEIARGKIVDTEGEYALVELSDRDKYLKNIRKGQIVIKI